MDVPSRNLFYDALLADYTEVPRTIVLSTHLVSEVSALLEEVVILDQGRLVTQSPVDSLRGRGAAIVGPAAVVDELTADLTVLAEQRLGGTKSVTVLGDLDDALLAKARSAGLEIGPVGLQDLFVHLTGSDAREGGRAMSAAVTQARTAALPRSATDGRPAALRAPGDDDRAPPDGPRLLPGDGGDASPSAA